MGKWKTRDFHQRRMDQIITNVDIALDYLRCFVNIYQPDHPNLAEAAESIASILILAEQNITILKAGF